MTLKGQFNNRRAQTCRRPRDFSPTTEEVSMLVNGRVTRSISHSNVPRNRSQSAHELQLQTIVPVNAALAKKASVPIPMTATGTSTNGDDLSSDRNQTDATAGDQIISAASADADDATDEADVEANSTNHRKTSFSRWSFARNGSGGKMQWQHKSGDSPPCLHEANGRDEESSMLSPMTAVSPSASQVAAMTRSARMSIPMTDDMRSRENRLTRISLCIVWLFIFCHVWKLVPTLYEGWNSDEEFAGASEWPKWLLHINDVSHTLIVFNSAVNFLIYVVL